MYIFDTNAKSIEVGRIRVWTPSELDVFWPVLGGPSSAPTVAILTPKVNELSKVGCPQIQ